VVTPANAYYNSIGRIGKIFPYLLPITALYVVSLFLFVPLWGIKGAAMALSIKQVILARTYLWLLAKHTNIPVRDFLIPTGEDLSLMFGLVRRGLTVMGCRR
jgi:O-antigen/teichoic acid export membrane protein